MSQSDRGSAGGEGRAVLRPWDGISIIVGIVVGVSLFRAPGPIFASVDQAWQGLLVWALALYCNHHVNFSYQQYSGD